MSDTSGEGHRRPVQSGGWQRSVREAGPYLGLGMQLALTMAFFTIGGYLLDGWLETTPWLTIAGALLGMVAVFVHLIRISRTLNRKDDAGT
jgi:ATP synthase protein I